jgi:hypothetical protein
MKRGTFYANMKSILLKVGLITRREIYLTESWIYGSEIAHREFNFRCHVSELLCTFPGRCFPSHIRSFCEFEEDNSRSYFLWNMFMSVLKEAVGYNSSEIFKNVMSTLKLI